MPIKPENAVRYPKNWKQIRAAVLERAKNKYSGVPCCEKCGVQNYAYRASSGEWGTDPDMVIAWTGEQKLTRIVLTVAHLDHCPENCDLDNLRAWCQRCHLTYDAKHHAQNARHTRRKKKNNLELDL